ncbi:LITAF-like zinc ribbon domain-containing protein [Sorangium sp. So ce1000]|uniref:LITAF-like zinc ribbon domain-containing protein n=1 Tax=Sorangium sp. So ce1000 TaxID=3133325 RepID=UPI003F60BFA8
MYQQPPGYPPPHGYPPPGYPPYGYPPQPVQQVWVCPRCRVPGTYPVEHQKASGAAWVIFFACIIFCITIPFCWLPLVLMKERRLLCSHCRAPVAGG